MEVVKSDGVEGAVIVVGLAGVWRNDGSDYSRESSQEADAEEPNNPGDIFSVLCTQVDPAHHHNQQQSKGQMSARRSTGICAWCDGTHPCGLLELDTPMVCWFNLPSQWGCAWKQMMKD
jgi:hypothetical protein